MGRLARLPVAVVVGMVAGSVLLLPAGAHYNPDVQKFGHLKKHFVAKAAARKPGTINAAKNPVDWTKLKGVPDALADGDDSTDGFTATKLGPADMPDAPLTSAASVIGTLALPAGSYTVLASLYITPPASNHEAECRLELGAAADDSGTLEVEQFEVEDVSVVLMVAGTLPAAGSAVIRCMDDGGPGSFTAFRQLRITAIELGALTQSTIP
jgi:hypothetical protein